MMYEKRAFDPDFFDSQSVSENGVNISQSAGLSLNERCIIMCPAPPGGHWGTYHVSTGGRRLARIAML
jgi:hypothetical protein